MEQKSMTALISVFARAYHTRNNQVTIFNDSVAEKLLTQEEYGQIACSMSEGIGFFNPGFAGTPEEALRWVVDHQLSPTPLGRAAFSEQSLERAVRLGARQYLIFGAGYDTFAYRQPSWAKALEIFEIDHPATARDKRERLKSGGLTIPNNVHFVESDFTQEDWQKALQNDKTFDCGKISFSTVLGVTYYLSSQTFEALIAAISSFSPKGSSLIFDYPDENSYTEKGGVRAKKQAALADAAKEAMRACYSYHDMERLLAAHNFLIYAHLTPTEITEQYFAGYNKANPAHPVAALDNTNYCLTVKE